jgi:hypothetical protein
MNRNHIAALMVAAAVVTATGVAITAGSDEIAGSPVAARSADPVDVAADPVPTTTTTRAPDPLDLDDFLVTLRVTDKQCFGDVGCNVTVEPRLEYVHTIETLENRSYSVTLTISGDESGPVITTIDGTGESYDVMPVLLSTPRAGVAPKVKVTDVQEY